jgi:hypothetical protein
MRTTSKSLALRDPSLAAALGALPTRGGADYGADFGSGISPYDPSRNIGFGYGMGFGVDASMVPAPPAPPAAHPSHPAHPHHQGWLQMYHHYLGAHARPPFWDGRYGYYGSGLPTGPAAALAPEVWASEMAETARRARLLDPNEHSRLKIERYSFSMSPALNFTLGTAAAFEATLQPNTRIRAQRIVMNAPAPNFVILDALQVANVNVFVGTQEDAFTYSAQAQGVMLDLPTLDPANRASVSGTYTGYLPPGFASEFSFQFIVTFQGPSTIVGGL